MAEDRNNPGMSPVESLKRARELLARGDSFEALQYLQRAYDSEPENPAVQSYYALAMAIERGQIRRSLDLCHAAVERAPGVPDLHLNLAQVQLKAGDKPAAVQALRQGLRCQPDHPELLSLLARLGLRRKPIFGSLPRHHPLNKYLGKIAARLHLR